LRAVLAVIGGAVLGGGVTADIHLVLQGNGVSGGFVAIGVIAGLGLGLLAAAFVPHDRH
jgi:hypothetical protein